MKTEQEIRKFRDALYQSAITMRVKHEPYHIMVLNHVRIIDYILDEKDDMDIGKFSVLLTKYDFDTVLAGGEAEKCV